MATMTPEQLREFVDTCKKYEQGQVTPAPWEAQIGKEGAIRTRAMFCGRIIGTQGPQAHSYVTADNSLTHYSHQRPNYDYLLILRNAAPDLLETIEAGVTIAAAVEYFADPRFVAHAYRLLSGLVQNPNSGIEAYRAVLSQMEYLLQVRVGVLDPAPYEPGDVTAARIALTALTVPTADEFAAMTPEQQKNTLNTLKVAITNQFPQLEDPGAAVLPDTPDPTMIYMADILLRSLAGQYDNAITKEFNIPLEDQMNRLIEQVAQAAKLLEEQPGVKSAAPYDAGAISTAKAALNTIVTQHSTTPVTFDALMTALNGIRATGVFLPGFAPMPFTPTPYTGGTHIAMNGRNASGTQYVGHGSK